jgi:uncharacterized protein
MIDKALIQTIRNQFALDWHGIHGAPHWARVRENGLRLAESTGANIKGELFAFFHDSRRINDGHDPNHGIRASEFARSLLSETLGEIEMELLVAACNGHSNGGLTGDITVCTCWDADRLDLGRVGIRPDPRYLCTATARNPQIIEWAFARSIR